MPDFAELAPLSPSPFDDALSTLREVRRVLASPAVRRWIETDGEISTTGEQLPPKDQAKDAPQTAGGGDGGGP